MSKAGALLYRTRVVSVNPNSHDPRYTFKASPTLDEIIAQQGKGPITDVRVLHGDFWPDDEQLEDFLAALDEWRGPESDPAG
jgi:hypothetical protein